MAEQNEELKRAGLKITLPRIKILSILQNPNNQHISAEDVYKILLEHNEEIGLATVYRVLNQFDDAGIVSRHHFEGGKSVFELSQKKHHDHLVCLKCVLPNATSNRDLHQAKGTTARPRRPLSDGEASP